MKAALAGAELFYDARLQGEGIPVLFLHGWGCTHTVFQAFYSRLENPWIAVDFPGHGESPEPPCPWGVGEYAKQIAALLESLSLKKVCVVAHSFGGRVALYLAAFAPELIGKMLITGGAGLVRERTPEEEKRLASYRSAQEKLNRAKKIPILAKPVEAIQKKLRDKRSSPDYLKLSESMKETFKKVIGEDLSPLLPRVSAPVLLIWGDADTETPLWMGRKMEKEMQDAALVIFEGRGHFAFAEEGARFLLILKAFLEEKEKE